MRFEVGTTGHTRFRVDAQYEQQRSDCENTLHNPRSDADQIAHDDESESNCDAALEAAAEAPHALPGIGLGRGLEPPPVPSSLVNIHGHAHPVGPNTTPHTTYSFSINVFVQAVMVHNQLPVPDSVMNGKASSCAGH